MSSYFIGQRVRIVGANTATECIGLGARIVGGFKRTTHIGGVEYEGWPVEVDGIGLVSRRGYRFVFPEFCLEPILPEGHTPSIYSYEELMNRCREGVVA